MVAEKNTNDLYLDSKIIESDLFNNINEKYDCIISNPPYISETEEIQDIVKDNEPHVALYASDNGLYYYKEIIKNSKKYLKEKYLIAFEIGETQGNFLKEYAKLYFNDATITVEKDMQGRDRFLFIRN